MDMSKTSDLVIESDFRATIFVPVHYILLWFLTIFNFFCYNKTLTNENVFIFSKMKHFLKKNRNEASLNVKGFLLIIPITMTI